jgi:hypothetical protein
MKNSLIDDIKKQLWETKEQLEHDFGIPRNLDIRTVELGAIEDSMKANMVGWIEALSWVEEKLEKGDK